MNLGTMIGGIGEAQPQIQQMQAMQQKKQQDSAIAKVLQQYAQKQGQAGGQPGQPGQPGQGGFAGGLPPLDKMMDMMSQSGLPADQQFEALKQYGAFATPYEKMLSQMEMKQQQLQNTASLTEERLKNMRAIATMNNGTKKEIADDNRPIKQENADSNRIRANNSRNWSDPEQRPQIGGAKDSGEDKDALKALDDTVALYKQEVHDAGYDANKHDAAMNKYNAAVKARAEYHKSKTTSKPVDITRGEAPEAAKLSDTEQRSFDGGKTWWHLQDGKPVKSE